MKFELVMADFAIATFAVDPLRLHALLPAGFAPQTFGLTSGSKVAFVSAVTFRNFAMRANGLRLPLHYVQNNYRAYALRAGEPCVWFFGSALSTPAAWPAEKLLGMPWYRARLRLQAHWDGDVCTRYELAARGAPGDADFACSGDGMPVARLDGFASARSGLTVLTHPLSGFVRRRNGRLLELRVAHAPLQPQTASASVARFTAFERLGLVQPDAKPHSVLLVKETAFEVFAPALL